ncbi:MAG: hypothetical protein ABSA69_11100 [Verrucomicrobiota bacterium]|jgi:hypothetical protein
MLCGDSRESLNQAVEALHVTQTPQSQQDAVRFGRVYFSKEALLSIWE